MKKAGGVEEIVFDWVWKDYQFQQKKDGRNSDASRDNSFEDEFTYHLKHE